MTFRNIHECVVENKRVLLFEIPSAPLGIPIACDSQYYGRAGESLKALSLDKLDEIRSQNTRDWTSEIITTATIEHLDMFAILQSKKAYAKKHANRFSEEEVLSWSDSKFLDRAKLTIEGQITRTALLLLGKHESAHFLLPHPSQLTWKLEGPERSYEHFGPPFIFSTTKLYQKIRNLQVRILPQNTLFPIEVAKYDQKIILEALHNCVAHQDYTRHGRIVVTEYPYKLVFENEGKFFEGNPIDYILGNKTPRKYRNPFLTQAMVELNMIDTVGSGIHSMFSGQALRYFPMTDYDLSESDAVKLTVHGQILDEAYSKLLIQKSDLPLDEIFLLDQIQKKHPIDDDKLLILRRKKLVEGRKPNIHISASIAEITEKKADYIRTRAQDDTFYMKLITDYLTKFNSASRQDIDKLLSPKLSDGLSEAQKQTKITNLISKMRQNNTIKNNGSKKTPKWILLKFNK